MTLTSKDVYFTNKVEKIRDQYNLFWSYPEAQADVDAYLRGDQYHEYRDAQKWIKKSNCFQPDELLDSDPVVFAQNDKALIIGNLHSFDTQQHPKDPKKAGMSFIHLLGIPRAQIFNGVSLTPDNCNIIDDIISLFESRWGVECANHSFRTQVVEHQRNAINENAQVQIKDVESDRDSNPRRFQEEVQKAKDRATESTNRWDCLQSVARELKVDDFNYGLHLWPDQSVPHLHVHVVARPSFMRQFSTKEHDEKTVDARELRNFILPYGLEETEPLDVEVTSGYP
ncbi:hypothetical protein PFICI_08809 [Pestalotiopsis fici W106-1]|uniref:HIT domain-containing protein n=1 Tax=Pestalotiopsis fici (strain W106-1 / CGMCC3.15140) TaxID=1229662 RepID=W3X1B5_PESFW|nr:uncharacterized protein PFICI_08809 [Pestalotiopsis fici W106-1]ETS78956.1 hypothetical protein PFICI_08809 [Pestalotiopsis fici W106-1]